VGPIALFDKSFLQSLSIDESIWFDHHFTANVCPMFYVETLADLKKSTIPDRTQAQEVRIIADKFPEMSGSPCAHHQTLCLANLMGEPIPMEGQIPLAGGRFVKAEGRTAAIYDLPPETEAFARWQRGEFLEVEHSFAERWRLAVSTLDLEKVAKQFRAIGVDGKTCNTLSDAKKIADEFVAGREKPFDRMLLASLFFSVPEEMRSPLLERWSIAGYPPLAEYAPYAAHVLTVEVFFQLALAARLIASERPSNRLDISYLFYLPFCMLFVSSDRLHRKCAPLFLKGNQEFVWGPDLKESLRGLNSHYAELPEEVKEKGVVAFADKPPDSESLVAKLWDRYCPGWKRTRDTEVRMNAPTDKAVLEEYRKIVEAPSAAPEEVNLASMDVDAFSVRRLVRIRKGNWRLLPKDLEVYDEI
jgi:hypothetical protein